MRFADKKIVIEGKKVFYCEANYESEECAVFLHGFPGSHQGIVKMAKKIKGLRIIVPDLPGCGKSEPLQEAHFLANYAKWLAKFVEKTSSDKKAIIIGHSFGARMAVAFAAKYPEKIEKMVLIAPVVKADSLVGKIASLDYGVANLLPMKVRKLWLFNGLCRAIKHKIIYKTDSLLIRKELEKIERQEIRDFDPRANSEVFNEFYKCPAISEGDAIKVKTLIIGCGEDTIATMNSVRELHQKRLPNADFEVMKKSGHLVVPEQPNAVAHIINKWLKKI